MEKVMVVPSSVISPFLGSINYITKNIDQIIHVIYSSYQFVDRTYAEYAPEYKQIIPYTILINESQYFLTKRLKKQTENRLHGMYSIGIGGHINPEESTANNIIMAGMSRELLEEVGIKLVGNHHCVGVINDLSTDVSNFHIGLVYPICTSNNISVVEKNKMTGHWATEEEINSKIDRLESWSQIVWEHRKNGLL